MNRYLVKIGTNLLTTSEGTLDLNRMRSLAHQICDGMSTGMGQFLLVTSGAITCGSEALHLKPVSIPEKQAAAAVGQSLLMKEYTTFFGERGIKVGQILLTRDVFNDAERITNVRNTTMTLLAHGILPIFNENDCVATDEIDMKFGDNDQMSLMVAKLLDVTHLVLLTDVDGVYDHNPKTHSEAQIITNMSEISDDFLSGLENATSGRSRGGMKSKLTVAKSASESGIDVRIANGRTPHVLSSDVGTHIPGHRQ
ncbi:MAG: glutamate 5-kinase [Candidatus Margulisbacteria bacterium]|nr:glutamate 5-kinase [Candidatus Margulisiibacteriota bacterium]